MHPRFGVTKDLWNVKCMQHLNLKAFLAVWYSHSAWKLISLSQGMNQYDSSSTDVTRTMYRIQSPGDEEFIQQINTLKSLYDITLISYKIPFLQQ